MPFFLFNSIKVYNTNIHPFFLCRQIIHNFGDQLPWHDVIRTSTLLLSLINETKFCKAHGPNLSNDIGASLINYDLETQRLIFVALANLLNQSGTTFSSSTFVEILKVTYSFQFFRSFLPTDIFLFLTCNWN